jgi:DNA-binding NtrC family response regulator
MATSAAAFLACRIPSGEAERRAMGATIEQTLEDGTGGAFGAPSERPETHLFVVLECGRPLAGGARHALGDIDRVTIGRGPTRAAGREVRAGRRELVVQVPDSRMSSRHATLTRLAQGFVLEDAGARNGCRVNGQIVDRALITEADSFELGHTIFRVANVATPAGVARDIDTGSGGARRGMATLVPKFAALLERVAIVAKSKVPIVLLGETGTGKEVLAHAIHELSGRPGEFVAVNCGAIPATLVETQFFGHVKGAFSGAVSSEPGYFRAASGGTLFLDEIGDLPPAGQPTLLRALQEREVVAVGATRPTPVDVRIITATHRSLQKMAQSGEFRRDLIARVAGLRVSLPPLRERREDLGVLIAAVLEDVAGPQAGSVVLTRDAGLRLVGHDWPLNVRELHQALALAWALASDGVLTWAHLRTALEEGSDSTEPASSRTSQADRALRGSVVAALEAHAGNVSEAARSLGKARTQIHRWIRRFGLDPRAFRAR